jgi:hypothetical protein
MLKIIVSIILALLLLPVVVACLPIIMPIAIAGFILGCIGKILMFFIDNFMVVLGFCMLIALIGICGFIFL